MPCAHVVSTFSPDDLALQHVVDQLGCVVLRRVVIFEALQLVVVHLPGGRGGVRKRRNNRKRELALEWQNRVLVYCFRTTFICRQLLGYWMGTTGGVKEQSRHPALKLSCVYYFVLLNLPSDNRLYSGWSTTLVGASLTPQRTTGLCHNRTDDDRD